jgi:hypothetical protein
LTSSARIRVAHSRRYTMRRGPLMPLTIGTEAPADYPCTASGRIVL